MSHARERGDADVVAATGLAFAAFGDREVADRAAEIALELSARKEHAGSREHLAASRTREARTLDQPRD